MTARPAPPATRPLPHPGLGVAVLAVALVAAVLAPGRPALATQPSGLWGGGFQNAVAVDPSGNGTVIVGSDIGGMQVSRDEGGSFQARNGSATRLADLTVASIRFAAASDHVYAATGEDLPGVSGFWDSSDDGQTWVRMGTGSVLPVFNGFSQDGVSYRSTGN